MIVLSLTLYEVSDIQRRSIWIITRVPSDSTADDDDIIPRITSKDMKATVPTPVTQKLDCSQCKWHVTPFCLVDLKFLKFYVQFVS